MSSTVSMDDIISVNMSTWKRRHLSHYKNGFRETLCCGDKFIRCVTTSPEKGRYNKHGYVIVGPFGEELGSILWDERGYTTGFRVNEIGLKRAKLKLDKTNADIERKMHQYEVEELDYMREHLSKMCGCKKEAITIERIVPGLNFNDNCSIIFRGPQIEGKSNFLGCVEWDHNGKFIDFEPAEKNIMAIRQFYIARERAAMERARNKSVNRTVQQKEEREISLGKELVGFIKSHVKEIAITTALLITLSSSINFFKAELNRDFINPAYEAGYQVVNVETHRTDDNQNFWYDYWDIAARYDDSYDFDSWVYGVYDNVGWNQESKIDCMNEVFQRLAANDITEYSSFVEYCEAKGLCKEKDGKLVVDARAYREFIRNYMTQLNGESLDNEEEKNSIFRI